MSRVRLCIIIVAGLAFSIAFVRPLRAESAEKMDKEKDAVTKASPEAAANVGNKICPVSGEEVGGGGMEPATYEHEGKIYNFCCPACIEEFKKEPQKYIKKVEEELQASRQQEGAEPKEEHQMMNETGHMH